MFGQVALAIVGTVMVLVVVAALAWDWYEKRWSPDARLKRAAQKRPSVADLIAKYRDDHA